MSHPSNLSQTDGTTSVSSDQKPAGSHHEIKNKAQNPLPSRNDPCCFYLPLKYISNTGISLHHCCNFLAQPTSPITWITALDLHRSVLLLPSSIYKIVWTPELICNYTWSHLPKTVLLITLRWSICLLLDPFLTCYVLLSISENSVLGSFPPGWFHSRLWKMERSISSCDFSLLSHGPVKDYICSLLTSLASH